MSEVASTAVSAASTVSLVDLVQAVRQQLDEAREAGLKDTLKFDVPSATIEVEVQATATTKTGVEVNAGVELKVLKFGASGSVEAGNENASTAKISITLSPYDETTLNHKLKINQEETVDPNEGPNYSAPEQPDPAPSGA